MELAKVPLYVVLSRTLQHLGNSSRSVGRKVYCPAAPLGPRQNRQRTGLVETWAARTRLFRVLPHRRVAAAAGRSGSFCWLYSLDRVSGDSGFCFISIFHEPSWERLLLTKPGKSKARAIRRSCFVKGPIKYDRRLYSTVHVFVHTYAEQR